MRTGTRSASSAPKRLAAARALTVLACVAIALAAVAGYLRIAVVDSDQFAARATEALRDPSVRGLIAERVTDEVILEQQADLLTARPLIASATSQIVGAKAFTGLFSSAVRDVHRTLVDRNAESFALAVADVGTVIAAALEQVRPELAKQLERSGVVTLLRHDVRGTGERAVLAADRVRLLAPLLALLAIALVAGALALSPDRRRTAVELGVGAAVVGTLLAVACGVVREHVVGQVRGADAQAAAGAVWDAFFADLRSGAWLLAGCGAIVAAAAGSLLRPVDLVAPLRRAGRAFVVEPRRPALRAARGVALVALGVTVLAARDAVVALLVTGVAVYLIYAGTSALLALVYVPSPSFGERVRRGPVTGRRAIVGVVAAALVATATTVFASSGGLSPVARAGSACNGFAELCSRRFDEVALATTHNSMSVPLPGWFASQQERPIADQLRDGIHGLQLDTHYADRLPNGRVRTYLGDRKDLRAQYGDDGIGEAAIDAAMRTRERLGFAGKGERGMYLCHGFCELGASRLEPVLSDIRSFLVSHPDDVIAIVNQDYVTPQDMVAAVRAAGLEAFAYRGPVDGEWPTLREMIDSGQRLVLLAENRAGAAPWYRLAYDRALQETPFHFSRPKQLIGEDGLAAGCAPLRGPKAAPLLLINHWVTTDPVPLPSHATEVNARGPLLRRVRECERRRGRMANLVAVNFYRRGDLFEVVDELNGVGDGRR